MESTKRQLPAATNNDQESLKALFDTRTAASRQKRITPHLEKKTFVHRRRSSSANAALDIDTSNKRSALSLSLSLSTVGRNHESKQRYK